MKALIELNSIMEDARNAMRANAKRALMAAVKSYFKSHPETEFIGWRQYTPGFNDGEPCYHSMGEVVIACPALREKMMAGHYELGFEWSEVDFSYLEDESYYIDLDKETKTLIEIIASMEDAWEDVFGTNTHIMLYPDKVVVEEYDCGY